jgi:hypothetical protein
MSAGRFVLFCKHIRLLQEDAASRMLLMLATEHSRCRQAGLARQAGNDICVSSV